MSFEDAFPSSADRRPTAARPNPIPLLPLPATHVDALGRPVAVDGNGIPVNGGRIGPGQHDDRVMRRSGEEGIRERQFELEGEEILTWEACTKIVSRERGDYYEFVVSPSFFLYILFHPPFSHPLHLAQSPSSSLE